MSDIHVEPDALEKLAAATTDRAEIMAELKNKLQAMQVPRASFGFIPGIGDRVFTAYDEFVDNLRDSLWEAKSSMNEIADTLKLVADQYRVADRHTADYLGSIYNATADAGISGYQ